MIGTNIIHENIENVMSEVIENVNEENTFEIVEYQNKKSIELINVQYVYDVAYFVIFLFLVLSFTDVGIMIVSKIISFFKTVFDDIDLKFMKIKK